jgi:pimeloyl-ACP methyl ester carboxylesterase
METPDDSFKPRDPKIFGLTRYTGRRAILFVHGWNSSQAGYHHRAEVVSRNLDAVCLTFDLRGHGRDAGNLDNCNEIHHLNDVLAAYDYLVSQDGVDSTRVGVSGASYGGYLAALLTAHRAVKRLLLRAPTLAQKQHVRPRQGETASSPIAEDLDSLEVLRRYAGDMLIIESERDEVIPRSTIFAYLQAFPRAQYQIIPEATHALTNPVWDDVFVKAIIRWFGQL